MNTGKNLEASRAEEAGGFGDVLPQQHYGVIAGHPRGDGARDLMLAVLDDAIRGYVTNISGKTARQRRLFEEVKSWIETRGDQAPFSFEAICETFDIDPDALRRRLKDLSPESFRRIRSPKRARPIRAVG